jgi:hypothetical protein
MNDVYVKPSPPPCDICGSIDHPSGHHDNARPGINFPTHNKDVGYPDTLETEQVLENRPDE